jgi:hypothetical protein
MSDRKTNLSGLKDMYWFVRLAIITGLFSTAITAEKLPHMIFYPAGDAPLAQKYAEYNQRWFDDKLPAESVEISWGESTGTYYTNYEDEGFHARISIIRKVEGYDNRVCMEVLHEMVHMKLALTDKDLFADDSGPAHDEKFQHEMLNLAEKGAFSECW